MAKSQQLLTLPVFGLDFGPQSRKEIQIGRVTFIAAKKIPRVWKRLGFKHPIVHYKTNSRFVSSKIFENAAVYAILKTNRETNLDDISSEFKEIQHAFWILASSFASFNDRKNASMSLRSTGDPRASHDMLLFDRESADHIFKLSFNDARRPNICEGFWVASSRRNHFFNLLKIIDGQLNVSEKWAACICRAAVLFGQSYLARHLAEAFTYNMIAIETLLTVQGEKFPQSLVDRLLAIFGWLYDDDPQPWKDVISRLYSLRCGFVHDGHAGEINGMDLFNADCVLQNLLTNICANTKSIKSKSDIIQLSNEFVAFRSLGKKPRRRLRFSFTQSVLTESRYNDVLNTSRWEY